MKRLTFGYKETVDQVGTSIVKQEYKHSQPIQLGCVLSEDPTEMLLKEEPFLSVIFTGAENQTEFINVQVPKML